MFTYKTNLIVFAVVLAVIAVVSSIAIAFNSIADAKSENDDAKAKIVELNGMIDRLQSTLKDTQTEISHHRERIEDYKDIFEAWSKATPQVSEAIKQIAGEYSLALENAHMYPYEVINNLEDEMLNAICSALRSTNPFVVVEEYKSIVFKANEARYDNVILSKIEQITENGVSFEEDSEAVASLREYYDSFSQNEIVVRSFVEQGIDKKVESLEKAIDSDEENDLAKAFEDAVAQINTPITLATSLKNANDAWNTLQNALETDDVLAESTVNARSLFVSYALRYEELLIAKEEADVINEMISKLVISPDLTTRDSIEFIETKISDWMQKFNIEAENANMVNDLTPSKTAYERVISELAALYEAYKNAVEKIGKVTQCSKPDIDNALKSYESIKDYKDADVILSLESPHTVAELYELIEESLEHYDRIVDKITSIRNEIDRLHDVDPDVTHEEISALDVSVSELLALEIALDALNTDEKDYVELLGGARILPYKNDAFREIKSTYDNCYEMANNDRDVILELVSIKDSSLNDVERATSVEEINKIVEKAVNDFNACLK